MREARARVRLLDRVFDALAHPARREILLVILYRGGRMNSGAIADRFSCEWATTTHHLAVLQRTGLLRVRRSGRERIYSLDAAALLEALSQFARPFRAAASRRRRP